LSNDDSRYTLSTPSIDGQQVKNIIITCSKYISENISSVVDRRHVSIYITRTLDQFRVTFKIQKNTLNYKSLKIVTPPKTLQVYNIIVKHKINSDKTRDKNVIERLNENKYLYWFVSSISAPQSVHASYTPLASCLLKIVQLIYSIFVCGCFITNTVINAIKTIVYCSLELLY
jgi:spore coat polysaccharide biosynthesis protein SpsF (cytidylyltransferase family)